MALLFAILEDNLERIGVMKEWLTDRLPMYEHAFTDDPETMIRLLEVKSGQILAVSLDHDLYDRADGSTELTGMIVSDYLAEREPTFPIIIHSSNERDSLTMKTKLICGGWKVQKVLPFDDTNWIGISWYPALKKAIRRAARLPPRIPVTEVERD